MQPEAVLAWLLSPESSGESSGVARPAGARLEFVQLLRRWLHVQTRGARGSPGKGLASPGQVPPALLWGQARGGWPPHCA